MRFALRTLLCTLGAALFAGSASALSVTDPVKINEVSYDPAETPEEPYEFIELYNAGGSTVFLDGAVITDEGNAGTGEATFQFPGTVGGTTIPLAPGAYLLLVGDVAAGNPLGADYEFFGGGADSDDAGVPNLVKTAGTGADLQLANGGDGVTLSTGVSTGSVIPCGEVVDGVSWETGGAGDTTALSSTVCSDATPNPGYTNGGASLLVTLQRCPNGVDTDNSTADFVQANRTPKAANGCSANPPVISNLRYAPCFVTASQPVTLSATVVDPNSDITSVRMFYRLDSVVPFDSVTATLGAMNVYSAALPGQADQAHVQYYMVARDAVGNTVKSPSTAPAFLRSYRVGLQTIASLQVSNGDSCATSTSDGKAVNVVGVCTHRAYEYSDDFFFIQAGIGANSGMKVFAPDSAFVPNIGDSVRVSGFIDEFRCQTEVVLFADCGTTLGVNRKVRARQLATVDDIDNEQHESMLVTIQGPISVVTGWLPPMVNNQEFRVRQGAASGWVGNDTFFPDGIGFSIVPDSGISLDNLTGIVGSRFFSPDDSTRVLRIEPRRDNDVDRDYTDIGDEDGVDVVRAFRLNQNLPNPFNPATTIEFTIPEAATARLEVFDAQGRLVRTLAVRSYVAPARDRVVWDGVDDQGRAVASGLYYYKLTAGEYQATRKMLLLK